MGKREAVVARVSYSATKPFVMGIHYAKRMPSISEAFGLFVGDELEGVVTYGTPPSSGLRKGICGPEFSDHVIELNRLCLKSNVKGDASMLVGRSIRMLGGDRIIVSFADTEQRHVGTVYQACNFIYCGLSAKRTDWKVRGREHLHGQTIADEFRGVQNRSAAMREKYGDDFYLAPRPRKHRYVFFSGRKKFKREALAALRYSIEAYPKECGGVIYE
jgi:hypothetical protein